MRYFRTLLSLSLFFGFLSCKKMPGDSTELQSLDNFEAGSNVTQNKCSGSFAESQLDPRVKKIIATENLIHVPQELKQEFDAAMSAVPTTLKNVFFSQGYTIEVRKGNAARCKSITGNPEDVACFERTLLSVNGDKVQDDNQAAREHVTVLIEAEPAAIRFGTLRAFGYLMSQRFAKLTTDAQGNPSFRDQDDPQWLDWKRDMTVNVLHDIATKRGISDKTFGRHRKLLNNDPMLIGPKATLEQRKAAWNQYAAAAAQNADHFSTKTLAEAVDTYWCSSASKNKMQQEYTEAFKLFDGELASALVGAWQNTVAGTAGVQSGSGDQVGGQSGLSLWGRRGYSRCSNCCSGMCNCGNGCCNRVVASGSGYNWNAGGFPGGLRQRTGSFFPRWSTGRLFPRLWGY